MSTKTAPKTIEFQFTRTIAASEVSEAWMNPAMAGNPWHMGDRVILNPEVDGFFYWSIGGTPHYGRFQEIELPGRVQHTWMSPNTLGLESTVTVTFEEKGNQTLMTLVHSGLPDDDRARSHEKGWNFFLDAFPAQFANAA